MPMDGGVALRQHMAERAARLRDISPAMRVVGEEMVLEVSNAFRARRSPVGEDWADLAESTLRARAAKLPGASRRGKSGALTKGSKKKRATALLAQGMGETSGIAPLIDTGRLRASAGRYKADAKGLSWSVVGYGGYHMSGSIKRPGRPPQRNFSVFEPDGAGGWRMIPRFRDYAMRVVTGYVMRGELKP